MNNKIQFNGKSYEWKWWEKADGSIGPCSYDSETTLIVKGEVPDFILGTAYNGETVYFIKKADLKDFFEANKKRLYMANASFDLRVADKVKALELIPFAEKNGRVIDLLLLDKLYYIGLYGMNINISLDKLSKKYLKVDLPKDYEDENGESVRTNYSKFLKKGVIDYDSMTHPYIEYAGIDAIATYEIAQVLLEKVVSFCANKEVDYKKLLSHHLQLKASIALDIMSGNGLHTDQEYLKNIRQELLKSINTSLFKLKELGWEPGKGSNKKMQEILEGLKIPLPRTGKTQKLSTSAEDLEPFVEDHEFIGEYIKYVKNKKLLDFTEDREEVVHARFNPIVATGRTSSFSPNLQNLPRDPRIRPIFRAKEGHCLVSIDYGQIELRTLAQICFDRYGFSKMLELINSGVDLHIYYASKLVGCAMEEVSKDQRQKGKIANFGFPGGLGIKSFIQFAKTSYGVILNEEEAKQLKNVWMDSFPEMKLYMEHKEIDDLVSSGLMQDYEANTGKKLEAKICAFIFKAIINGEQMTKSTGRAFTDEEKSWAFDILKNAKFPNKKEFTSKIKNHEGSRSLYQNFIRIFNTIKFNSGRVRGNCSYTQSKNTPFQGLASDGAKEAMWELTKSGYRLVNFIHDEFIFEIPLSSNLEEVEKDLIKIIVDSMKIHVPDVDIEADAEYMINWSKSGTHYVDDSGNLQPLEKKEAA